MTWDPVWEEVFKKQEWGKYPSEDLIRFISRNFYHVPSRSQVKILEVGCGPGANLWFMAREGFSVYGIDGSETAVLRASNRLREEVLDRHAKLVVGDIANLPFSNDYFDAVIDCEAIYCNSFESSVAIYNELARVTKRGGKLFSRTFAKGSWGDETGEVVGHNAYIVEEGPLHSKGYSRFTGFEEIEQMVKGFCVQEIQLLTRKYMNVAKEVKEWIIIGEKR